MVAVTVVGLHEDETGRKAWVWGGWVVGKRSSGLSKDEAWGRLTTVVGLREDKAWAGGIPVVGLHEDGIVAGHSAWFWGAC